MNELPEFRLEAYFSRWEFTARHHLTASDMETMSVAELLELADEGDRRDWAQLRLGYTETFGDPRLRAAIAATYGTVGPDDVITFAGAEEGLVAVLRALLGPADHAVVLTPNYQAMESVPAAVCAVSGVPLEFVDGRWRLDVDAVLAAIRPQTRVVAVNFPNNPTGAVIPEADFRRLVAECDARGVRVFSDEVYRGIELDPAMTLPQAADLSPTAVSLNVMSKAYGLPGLRVGWVATRDPALRATLERAKHYGSICNAGPSEVLARIALTARDRILARNRAIVAANIPIFQDFFDRFPAHFEFSPPDGGCVCYPRWIGPGPAEHFARALVEEAGVLVLPPSIYTSVLGPTPTDRFRIGVGRRDPEPALAAVAGWLRSDRPYRPR